MGKMKIRLYPDGTIHMETEGIKGKKCVEYAKLLEQLADANISHLQTTNEYYEEELAQDQEVQHLKDNLQ